MASIFCAQITFQPKPCARNQQYRELCRSWRLGCLEPDSRGPLILHSMRIVSFLIRMYCCPRSCRQLTFKSVQETKIAPRAYPKTIRMKCVAASIATQYDSRGKPFQSTQLAMQWQPPRVRQLGATSRAGSDHEAAQHLGIKSYVRTRPYRSHDPIVAWVSIRRRSAERL